MKKVNVRTLTGVAIFTALVVVLQFLGSFIRFGMFSISLVLIPIVVGAALYGVGAGAWLGFAFGVVVLLSGDAAAFLAVNVPGTILTVLAKGTTSLAVGTAAILCPVVNTGVFLLGCAVFFLPTITGWGEAAGYPNVGNYILFGLVGGNFLFEVLFNIILSPVILRLIRLGQKSEAEQ